MKLEVSKSLNPTIKFRSLSIFINFLDIPKLYLIFGYYLAKYRLKSFIYTRIR